jgi:hypothetical protein
MYRAPSVKRFGEENVTPDDGQRFRSTTTIQNPVRINAPLVPHHRASKWIGGNYFRCLNPRLSPRGSPPTFVPSSAKAPRRAHPDVKQRKAKATWCRRGRRPFEHAVSRTPFRQDQSPPPCNRHCYRVLPTSLAFAISWFPAVALRKLSKYIESSPIAPRFASAGRLCKPVRHLDNALSAVEN